MTSSYYADQRLEPRYLPGEPGTLRGIHDILD
jgi:hypothetical protein